MTRALVVGATLAFALSSAAEGDPARTHVVAQGETLWHIAQNTVGDGTLWPALYLANRDQIKDPSRVYAGQELVIPEIDPAKVSELRREAEDLQAP